MGQKNIKYSPNFEKLISFYFKKNNSLDNNNILEINKISQSIFDNDNDNFDYQFNVSNMLKKRLIWFVEEKLEKYEEELQKPYTSKGFLTNGILHEKLTDYQDNSNLEELFYILKEFPDGKRITLKHTDDLILDEMDKNNIQNPLKKEETNNIKEDFDNEDRKTVNNFFILNKREDLLEEFYSLNDDNKEAIDTIIDIVNVSPNNIHLKSNEKIKSLKDFIFVYSKLLKNNKTNKKSVFKQKGASY